MKRTSFPMLYSSLQPLSGEIVGDAKLLQNELVVTREYFPTSLEAFEAAITPRKEEKLALLQTDEIDEHHTPASPRRQIKSLSPTRFFKKASKRLSSAVAQLSGRVFPAGTSDSSSRKETYQEASVAQNKVDVVRQEAPRESAVQPKKSYGNLAQDMYGNAKEDSAKEDPITSKEGEGRTNAKQSTLSRTRARSRSAGRLQLENDNARASIKRTNNGKSVPPH
ncbi:hypothetical protein FisN_6Lu456 [Fistulifera solaris]|uniref:Uncharacterized protein n=1 Tax=Fistulifera solaris TaxID=1519565 RepID=A0A1Z5JSZ9_FISSO|nr:hypothetical protein FisN_6Lu456 [Fistulifera solaris]|eukprot:GAX17150.1 hypothetical protein FisN_6Lu456 [Fistulifera solaris]